METKFKEIVLEYESEPDFVAFDDLRHLAQNIATRTGATVEHAYNWLFGWFSVQPDTLTKGAQE